jgi:SAM-dependent methyltransferase
MGAEPPSEQAFDALAAVLDRVQDYFRDHEGDGVDHLRGRPESWSFVHWRTRDVVEQLQTARAQFPERTRPRLLECGAGFGFVTELARELGFNATGIELDPRYVGWARKLFPFARVVEDDLLTFDDWASWDVVYYYAPFHDDHPEVATAFEEKIEDLLRPGGIVIANHKVSERWRGDPRFELLRAEADIAFVLRKRAA